MNSRVICSFPKKRLKHVVSLRRTRVDEGKDDRPYVGLENIESWTGRLLGNSAETEEHLSSITLEGESLSNLFEPGDVLFGKLRPYLAKAWVAEFPGRATTELLAMRPMGMESRFLCYVCLWHYFVETTDASTFGSKMPRADWNFIGNIPVPIPKWAAQCAIAEYLDRETARLDELVAEKTRLLDLLSEKRRALITRTVTRGLDPNVPLSDSGISWLGKIPAHWNVRRIAWLFKERDKRGEPNLKLLEVSINTGVVIREFSDERIETTAADFNTYKVARRGDVVFNKMRMWQGAVGVAPEDGLVSPDYVVAEPVGLLSSAYAEMLLQTAAFSAECARHSHGIVWDRLRLYWTGFRDIKVPLPPLREQAKIVDRIGFEIKRLDELSKSTESTIALVKERRSGVIAAAVSGHVNNSANT